MTTTTLEPAATVAVVQTPQPPAATDERQPSAELGAGVALGAAALLAACGGGGGGGDAAGADGIAAALAAVPPSDAEAARFLAQAGFSASSADIAALKARGYGAWFDEQFAMAGSSSHFDWMIARGYGDVANRNGFNGVDNTLWRKLMSSPDVLRQRVVLALSEIFVISMAGLPVTWRGFAVAAYVDMLGERAFGSFRELLEGVTLSCGMGTYLNLRGNKKEDPATGRVPDENYAREVMQLFTIGLVELNADGTPVLDAAGKPRETYGQSEITELARVFTGWDFDTASSTDPAFMRKPMVHTASRFSTGAKRVLKVDIPATADGPGAMKTALDTLAAHPNVGPFIGRQLIQRLVTSNPSPAYVARVTAAFNNNGAGQRGDMKAVIKAILLDSEARNPTAGPGNGRLREPVQRFIQWGRTFGLASPTDLWNIGDTSNPGTRLGQSPLRAPSVFNFFRPGYVPPNSALGSNGVTAPEFQLCNESTVVGYLNFMQGAIANGIGETRPAYAAELAQAGDAQALVSGLALRLAGDALAPATLNTIVTAVGAISASTDAGKLNRVQAAVLLVMACPEYQIQK